MKASELRMMAERMMAREGGDPEVVFWVCRSDMEGHERLEVHVGGGNWTTCAGAEPRKGVIW